MKKSTQVIAIFIFLNIFSIPAFSQWVQRLSLTGSPRSFATGFSIADTAYIVGGFDGNNVLFEDVWAFDVTNNTWTQKGNFPGGFRSASTAFTIGNKAYFGTGNNGATYLNDFWEYDPTSDTWLQKADFPGNIREEAVSFSIGNLGYLGTGQVFVVTPNFSFTETFADFYEYNPVTNTWTQKDSVPGPTRAYAVGGSIGNKGYIGLGGNDDQSDSFNDFYEYDPASNTWTAKATMIASGRAEAGLLTTATDLYVIGGINFPNFNGFPTVFKYNPATDVWSNVTSFGGSIIIAPIAMTINGLGYVGTGSTGGLAPRKDWWEFTPPSSTSINEFEKNNLTAFLNPANGILTVKCDENIFDSNSILQITDLSGKIVLNQSVTGSLSNEITIDVSSFSKGLYLLNLQSDKRKSQAIKFLR